MVMEFSDYVMEFGDCVIEVMLLAQTIVILDIVLGVTWF